MGRGRQKAKHTKVARELKYFSPDTNYTQLERELAAKAHGDSSEYDDLAAKYGALDDEDDFDDEDESEDDEDHARLA